VQNFFSHSGTEKFPPPENTQTPCLIYAEERKPHFVERVTAPWY